jgi:hypothetical protein
MKNEKNNILSEEHLRKIKYRVDYKINETPKYKPLINVGEEFDEVPAYHTLDGQPVPNSPSFTNEAGDQEEAPKELDPVEPSNDQPITNGTPPAPAFDKTGDESGNVIPPPPANDMGIGNEMNNPEGDVNNIQNDIIKHNIEAMKNIHDQLESLNNIVQGLNSKIDNLDADVEEVREPSNSEKLMNKTSVSYPYYFNLNDLWSGNWFNEQRDKENEKGIRKLPDGTYIADFDDLPQSSKTDIQNSFNDY